MTHSLNCNRKLKRESECDDFDSIVPSAKRLKVRSTRDNQCTDIMFNGNVSLNSNSHHFFNETHIKNQALQNSADVIYSSMQHDINQHNIIQAAISCTSEEYAILNQMNYKYLPDLNAIENPHYYENNRLLFELYVERIRRSSCQHINNTSHNFP